MKRREALQAKDQKRPAKTLYAWDFLIGVQDVTRQGALRFRPSGTQAFLDNDAFAAPPVTTLRELEQVAWQLTHKRIDDLDALRSLAPAFDVNPNIDKAEHVLNIDDMDNRPDLRTALSTAAFYGLTAAQGRHIVDAVMGVVDTWRDVANQVGISRADIELTAAAFSAHEAWQGHETRSKSKN